MDSIVKQRLVGALILLALAVVFWPIIFVPEAQQAAPVVVEVPEAPPVDLSTVREPDNIGLRRGEQAVAQEQPVPDVELPEAVGEGLGEPLAPRSDVAPVADVEAAADVPGPTLDEDGLPVAWALQVATMGSREGAESLRDELVAAGYKGYLKRLRRDERVLYRVLVGPRYAREDLEPIKAAVDARWGVESLIMRYLP